jgi:hypothetical protein
MATNEHALFDQTGSNDDPRARHVLTHQQRVTEGDIDRRGRRPWDRRRVVAAPDMRRPPAPARRGPSSSVTEWS